MAGPEVAGFRRFLVPESSRRIVSKVEERRWDARVRSRGNTRPCMYYAMKVEWRTRLGPSRSTRRGRKDEGGRAEEAVEPGNRDVFEQTRDTRVPPPPIPLSSISLFPRRGTPPLSLLPTPPPTFSTRSRFSLSRSYAFFSPSSPSLYRFTMVDDAPLRRLPPSPPDPSSWGGLKCHSFSSCARFHAPKESVFPFLSFSLSIFFSLSLLLSSHIVSLPRSALAFVDRVILAPGRRQNRGEMGRAIFAFLLCWKW